MDHDDQFGPRSQSKDRESYYTERTTKFKHIMTWRLAICSGAAIVHACFDISLVRTQICYRILPPIVNSPCCTDVSGITHFMRDEQIHAQLLVLIIRHRL